MAGRVADSTTVLNASQSGYRGHSEVQTPETQHYFAEQDFVAIGNKWVTGRISGITRRFFYFDALFGGHKKSPE
jgi:hypothetical protein